MARTVAPSWRDNTVRGMNERASRVSESVGEVRGAVPWCAVPDGLMNGVNEGTGEIAPLTDGRARSPRECCRPRDLRSLVMTTLAGGSSAFGCRHCSSLLGDCGESTAERIRTHGVAVAGPRVLRHYHCVGRTRSEERMRQRYTATSRAKRRPKAAPPVSAHESLRRGAVQTRSWTVRSSP
jgi:hypothetical protein